MAKDKVRVFQSEDKNGNPLTLKFVRPNYSISTKADLKAKEAYSKAFRGGLLVNSEVLKVLKERGLLDEAFDKEAERISTQLAEALNKLDAPGLSNEEGQKIVLEVKLLRNEQMRHNSVYSNVVDNTCESLANEARNQFLAASCVVDAKTNSKVFKDLEDFLSKAEERVAMDSYREAAIAALEDQMDVELPSDLTSHYPENKWLEARKQASETAVEESKDAESPEAEKKSKKKKAE